jgi:hypothetical protein
VNDRLIAIMLGRLEMDVDECIDAYRGIAAAVFGQKVSAIPFGLRGNLKSRYSKKKLETAIQQVVTQSGRSEKELLNDGEERRCKRCVFGHRWNIQYISDGISFVCAVDSDTKTATRLRSYSLSDEANIRATICEAALATSAATTFFEPVKIRNRTFVDGGLRVNNPVYQVEGEASSIWRHDDGEIKPLVKCFISIGTGTPDLKAIETNGMKFLTKTLADIVTDTEATATAFIGGWNKQFLEKRYFRFNVEQGLHDIGLDEYTKTGAMEGATDVYLNHPERKSRLKDCIRNLSLRHGLCIEDFS